MKDPTRKDVLLQHVDRDLFDRALAKCRATLPYPLVLKRVIADLVRRWLDESD